MTSQELKKRLEMQEILLIDVREGDEYQQERIEGAHLIPLGVFSYEKFPKTSCPIVIYCRSGKRSEEACRRLLIENPNVEVYSLEGGIMAWNQLAL